MIGIQETTSRSKKQWGDFPGSLLSGEHHEICWTWAYCSYVRYLFWSGQSLCCHGALPRRWLVSVALWPLTSTGEILPAYYGDQPNNSLISNFTFAGTTSRDRCPHYRVRIFPLVHFCSFGFFNTPLFEVTKCCLLLSTAIDASLFIMTSNWRMCSASGLPKTRPSQCMYAQCKLAERTFICHSLCSILFRWNLRILDLAVCYEAGLRCITTSNA